MQNNEVTIHVVDDDPGTCKYLTELITTVKYKVMTYNTASDFLNNFNNDGLGCLLIDIRLPGISGLDLQQQLRDHNIDFPVIIMSGYGDVSTAVRAMKAGALDFIEKPFSAQRLLELIHKAVNHHQDSKALSSKINHIEERYKQLTNREHEVMDLVVDGHQNKDIAQTLNISIKTVEVHRSNVMEKMKANSIVDLVRMHMLISQKKN